MRLVSNQIFNENKLIGYIENDKLFGLDADGYFVEICEVDNNAAAMEILRKWQLNRNRDLLLSSLRPT